MDRIYIAVIDPGSSEAFYDNARCVGTESVAGIRDGLLRDIPQRPGWLAAGVTNYRDERRHHHDHWNELARGLR